MPLKNIWLGASTEAVLSIDPFTVDKVFDFHGLDNLHVISGVTKVSKLIIRYRLETDLIADDIEGDAIPWPVDLGVSYVPAPDGEAEWSPGEEGGGASWRDTVRWVPQSVARTGVPSTKWWAQTEVPIVTQCNRIIHDKTTAGFFFGFGYKLATSVISTPAFTAPQVTGWMQIDYLLSNAE